MTQVGHVRIPNNLLEHRLCANRNKNCGSHTVEDCYCLFFRVGFSFPVPLGTIIQILTQLRFAPDCLKRRPFHEVCRFQFQLAILFFSKRPPKRVRNQNNREWMEHSNHHNDQKFRSQNFDYKRSKQTNFRLENGVVMGMKTETVSSSNASSSCSGTIRSSSQVPHHALSFSIHHTHPGTRCVIIGSERCLNSLVGHFVLIRHCVDPPANPKPRSYLIFLFIFFLPFSIQSCPSPRRRRRIPRLCEKQTSVVSYPDTSDPKKFLEKWSLSLQDQSPSVLSKNLFLSDHSSVLIASLLYTRPSIRSTLF